MGIWLNVLNIYNYSNENQYKRAVFFLECAHRKSIVEKILDYEKRSEINLNWTFYKCNMDLEFIDFAVTLDAGAIEVPDDIRDEPLFLTVRSHVLELLSNENTKIFHFGYAPDNTSDGQDELLVTGTYYRIIGYQKNLGIDFESTPKEILNAFHYLVSNYYPFWTSIFEDCGETKKEITIELLYQDVFL